MSHDPGSVAHGTAQTGDTAVSYRFSPRRAHWSVVAVRILLFAFVWWVLIEGQIDAWWIGVPSILLATLCSLALLAPVNLVWHELLRFIPFFLVRSFLGGVDVAWRAFHPGMPISPDMVEYPLRLPSGLPSVFLANTISLLPGTLSAELAARHLTVHVLNGRKDVVSELETLERRVAALFAVPLSDHGSEK